MKHQHLSFPEAVSFLAGRLGISLPASTNGQSLDRYHRFYDLNMLTARFYHYMLLQHRAGDFARKYLQKRGINGEAINDFYLGYAPGSGDALYQFLTGRQYRPEELNQIGLVFPAKKKNSFYDRFRHRLVFPIHDQGGRIIGFGARALSDQARPKYLNSPETVLFHKSRLLYALPRALTAIRTKGHAVIVEGYLDAITAHQYDFRNVVASLGTAFTSQQAGLLARYTREVVIAYDADAAGEAATLRGLDLLRDEGCRVKIAVLPPHTDPDSFLKKKGAEAFQALIGTEALSLIQYKLELAKKKYGLMPIEGKVAVFTAQQPDLA
jgi:DNA primase